MELVSIGKRWLFFSSACSVSTTSTGAFFLLVIVSLPGSSRLASGARGGWKEVTGRKKTPFAPPASINTEGVIRLVVYGSDRRFYENRLHDQTWQG